MRVMKYMLGCGLWLLMGGCYPEEFDPNINAEHEDVLDIPMVHISSGSFQMGGTEEQDSEVEDAELPVHTVRLSEYYISKYEVTQKLWVKVMGSNPSATKGEELPVEQVSWDDVQEFIQKLNEKTKLKYRLPTEAEWEYAARGGKSAGKKYSGGDKMDVLGWYKTNSSNVPHSVGEKLANELGIYDMSGNVSEWCLDHYDLYSEGAQTNPQGPAVGTEAVIRGGSYISRSEECRVSARQKAQLNLRQGNVGFRLVRLP